MSQNSVNIFDSPLPQIEEFLNFILQKIQTQPKNCTLRAKACALYLRLGNVDAARLMLDKVLSSNALPDHQTTVLLGRMMLRTSHHRWAHEFLLPFVKQGTDNLQILTIAAIAANRLSNLEFVNLIADSAPENFETALPNANWLVAAALRTHRHSKALKIAKRNYELVPTVQGAHLVLHCLDAMDLPLEKVSFLYERIVKKEKVKSSDYYGTQKTLKLLQSQATSNKPNRTLSILYKTNQFEHPKPRIALCLSGQMRSFEKAAASIRQNLLEQFDTDIFIYAWDQRGFKTSGFQFIQRFLPDEFEAIFPYRYLENRFPILFPETVAFLRSIEATPIEESNIRAVYPDASISITSEHEFQEKYFTDAAKTVAPNPAHLNQLKMYYGIYHCNKMKLQAEADEGFKYDLVIRARADCYLPAFTIYEPDHYRTQILVDKIHPNGYGDQFALSTSANMDMYAEMWPVAQSIVGGTFDKRFYNDQTKIVPHESITAHLKTTGLSITNTGFPAEDIIAEFLPDTKTTATLMLKDMSKWTKLTEEDLRLKKALQAVQ